MSVFCTIKYQLNDIAIKLRKTERNNLCHLYLSLLFLNKIIQNLRRLK
jgi:hypothetical protein